MDPLAPLLPPSHAPPESLSLPLELNQPAARPSSELRGGGAREGDGYDQTRTGRRAQEGEGSGRRASCRARWGGPAVGSRLASPRWIGRRWRTRRRRCCAPWRPPSSRPATSTATCSTTPSPSSNASSSASYSWSGYLTSRGRIAPVSVKLNGSSLRSKSPTRWWITPTMPSWLELEARGSGPRLGSRSMGSTLPSSPSSSPRGRIL